MNLKLTLTIILTISFIICKAQTIDSIEAKASYGSKISDVQLLMELEHIDYYKVQFKNAKFKRGYLFLTTKEYWNGKVTNCDTLLPLKYAKENFKLNSNDTNAILALITKPVGDSILFNYRYSGMSLSRRYKRTESDEYSLRDGLVTNDEFKKIPTNKVMPLFVYSLPYEDPKQPGYLYYCALTANGVPPDKWWDKYKVRHYIVVNMEIVTE